MCQKHGLVASHECPGRPGIKSNPQPLGVGEDAPTTSWDNNPHPHFNQACRQLMGSQVREPQAHLPSFLSHATFFQSSSWRSPIAVVFPWKVLWL